jgi:hypothetical protein
MKSEACKVERQYANSLGKPILPLTIESADFATLPPDIAPLQVIDYSQPSEANAFKLIGAIMRLPPPNPLPNPLPEPPGAPASYWTPIADQLSATVLNLDQQFAIVGRLEGAFAPLADPDDRPIALELLTRMEARSDLYAVVDRRIATLRASTKTKATPDPPLSEQPRPQRGTAKDMGGAGPTRAPRTQNGPSQPPSYQQSDRQTQAPPYRPQNRQTQPPSYQPQGEQPQTRPVPAPVKVSPHWVMAIVALFICIPTGIPAVVCASRVKPSLEAGRLASAQKSSSQVKVLFWISVTVFVLFWVIVISAANSSKSQGAMDLISPVFT